MRRPGGERVAPLESSMSTCISENVIWSCGQRVVRKCEKNLDVILIFSENEMSTWEDLVVNEPHLSSLPPALASSLVKEFQGTRGVAKVKLQNQWHVFFLATVSNDKIEWPSLFNPQGKNLARREASSRQFGGGGGCIDFLKLILFSRWLHQFLYFIMFIFKSATLFLR